MGLITRNGWGVVSAQIGAASVQGGTLATTPNVGVGILITPGVGAQRLTSLSWRVDIAPDVPPGSVNAPDKYRLMIAVASSSNAPDVTPFQVSAGYVNEPSIPQLTRQNSPLDILYDEWLDSAVSFPGLDVLQPRDFPDAGPTILAPQTMFIALFPMITPLAQVPLSPSNAFLHLMAYGTADGAQEVYGSAQTVPTGSIPRYDIRKP